MNLEEKMLEKFQVEELEKRFEFAWIDSVVIGGPNPPPLSEGPPPPPPSKN